MQKITSASNSTIRELKKLKLKKGRQEQGRFLAEGVLLAEEALEAGCAQMILTVEEALPVVRRAQQMGVPVLHITDAVMDAVSSAKTPQKALAVVSLEKSSVPEKGGLFVALEDVSDPQNVGTMIRTADAVGASGVILSPGCADYTGPKAVRAAMGSLFHLPVCIAEDFYAELGRLKSRGLPLIAGHLAGEEKLSPCGEGCVLIGNESRGLSEQASKIADVKVRIPIYGKAESLNAAVAAGILLYGVRGGFFA